MMAKAVPEYVHHPDRIKTPLKRRGNRGDGDFVPISWEEAYSEIGEKLNGFKEQNGADSVLFFTGWEKWYRHMLHRLAYSFGSVNYGTESSSCFLSLVTANKIASGYNNVPDYKNAGVIIFWSLSDLLPFPVEKVKDLGVKNNSSRSAAVEQNKEIRGYTSSASARHRRGPCPWTRPLPDSPGCDR